MDKKEFLSTYEKVKKGSIDINSLDTETIKRIFMIAAEELNINSRIIDDKMKLLKESISDM